MTTKIKKWVIKLLLITSISVAILAVGILFLFAEQERLAKIAVGEINEQIKGELTFETSELSLFKHFPSMGVALNQVRFFPDKSKTAEAIFIFERVYAGIRPFDLIQGKRDVRRLSFHKGKLNLVREAGGTINLLEALNLNSGETSKDVSFNIDLQKITFKELAATLNDKANDHFIAAEISQLTSSLKSEGNQVKVTLASDLELDMTSPRDTTLFRHKKLQLDFVTNYQVDRSLLEISKGTIKLQDGSFSLHGTADLADDVRVNIKVKGDEPNFNLLSAFLPGDVKSSLKPFSYDGHVYFNGIIYGSMANGKVPFVELTFGCKDAWFVNETSDKKLDQLTFKGRFTNGPLRSLKTSELHIMDVHARPGKGLFSGNFVIRDFTDPQILMQLQSELELKFIGDFFGILDLQQFTGKIKLDMNFKEIMDIDLPEQSLNKLKEGVQSRLTVEDLSFRIPGYPHQIQNMNLRAEMNNARVTVDSALFRIGNSDLRLSGSISDIRGFIRNPGETITLALNASSDNIILKELVAYDTALARQTNEEIHKFNVELTLETSVEQLLHPSPLPLGKFEIKHLRASFKTYGHSLKDIGATVNITDSALLISNLNGMVDSSDMRLSGRIRNYKLWFQDLKSGKTEIAFDLKAKRFATQDLLTRETRRLLPRGYRREMMKDAWVKAKVELRYDTTFRFARAEIFNFTCLLNRHNFLFKDIKGKVRYGARVLAMDTLTGSVGKSDFDISMRLFSGANKQMKKRTNYFHLKSVTLDVDEIAAYDFSVPPLRKRPEESDSLFAGRVKADSIASSHAKAYNIFTLPFSEFNVWVDVGKLKYHKLWIKDMTSRLRMTEDHQLHIDTIGMKIAGGTVGLKGQLNGSDTSKIFFNSVMKVDQVDLEKVMLKLDHFGKDVVINKNIKGRLSGEIKSKLQVHPNLVPLMHNSTAELDISIFDGSLVDFAPMRAMAGYFKDKNLRLVRFDSLKNELTYTKGVLSIPSMDINSSLGAIQISGKQSIDLTMEYYMRIPMKMVTQAGFNSLFGKKEGEVDANQIDEIEYSDKTKKGMFVNVKVSGTPSDYKVSLGRQKSGG